MGRRHASPHSQTVTRGLPRLRLGRGAAISPTHPTLGSGTVFWGLIRTSSATSALFLAKSIGRGGGGFAAYEGTHTVSLSGGAEIPFRQDFEDIPDNPFVDYLGSLRFGHYTATGTIVFANPLRLGSSYSEVGGIGGVGSIIAHRGRDLSRADAVLSGGITGVRAPRFEGNGRIDITASVSSTAPNPHQILVDGAELKPNAQPIGAIDCLLAGHALSLGAGIVTGNVREFRRVPGLVVEDWHSLD